MSVAYEAVLDAPEDSVLFLADLLGSERVRRGTRRDTRALPTRTQAVLVLRWFLDDTRMSGLARDNGISSSTAYAYRDGGIAVLEALVPSLHGALLAARIAGYTYVIADSTLIRTDRISTRGPTVGVDLRWSGKHKHHGRNVQVVSAPDGWPLWTSGVRPGREHDMWDVDGGPADLQRDPRCFALSGGTRELAAQDHLQGLASLSRVSVAVG